MPKCTILKAIAEALDNSNSNYPNRERLNDRVKLPRRKGNGEIKKFQNDLAGILGGSAKVREHTEVYLFKQFMDRADILIPNVQEYTVIIEIDATRADQVAKKMMSRFSWAIQTQKKIYGREGNDIKEEISIPADSIVYVSLLYPGTNAMNPEECKKYFVMGAEVLTKLNSNNIFIGYIISDALKNDYCYCSGSSVCGCSGAVSCNCRTSKNGAAQMSAPVVPPQQACNGTSMNGLTINDAKAADADLYRKYLEDNGVHTPDSIECYMHPLNIVHSIGLDSAGIEALQKQLASLHKKSNKQLPSALPLLLLIYLSKFSKNKNKYWSDSKISYWKKYCAYCKWLSVNNLP